MQKLANHLSRFKIQQMRQPINKGRLKPFRRPYHFGGTNKMIYPPSKSGSASKFRLRT